MSLGSAGLLQVLGGLACALLLGGMVSFTGVFARIAFARLPREQAAVFMQAAFPVYHGLMGAFAGSAAAALAWIRPWDALALAGAAAGFLAARVWLLPRARSLHADREAGVPGAAERFAVLHRQGASLNLVQLIIALIVLARLLAGA